MHCAVTGGCGFIGSHAVAVLRETGHSVIVVDQIDGADKKADICDTETLTQIFVENHIQIVFHIAAMANAREALQHPVKALQINVVGTASVFEAAKLSGVQRVILASTCWVAGAMGAGFLDETAPFLPTGAGHIYTTTKISSELIAHDYSALYNLPFTILRYGIPYGPRMWPGLVLRSFLDNVAANKPLTIFGDGNESRSFLYIRDLAEAHVHALKDVAINQTYNLDGMRPVTIKELAESISSFLGNVEIIYKDELSRKGELKNAERKLSSHKAYVELGWKPKIDLTLGVHETILWYHQNVSALPIGSYLKSL